jgi:hypothetical protein
MCFSATLGIKERFFACSQQGFASHPFGVPLTEIDRLYFANLNQLMPYL